MTFKYDPAKAVRCLKDGIYTAWIKSITTANTRSGLPMLVMDFDVTDGECSRVARGWIINPLSLYLLRELAEAVEDLEAFDAGEFDPWRHLGSEISVELRTVQNDLYGEQNIITHYHRKRSIDSRASPPPKDSVDDIPF
jgi:hypothetical protein